MLHAELGSAGDTYYWSHTRIDSILFGCILATWNNPAIEGRSYIGGHIGFALVGTSLVLLSFAVRDPIFRDTWRYTVQGLGLFLLFNFALRTRGLVATVLSSSPLRVIAELSYFLYLIHFPLLEAAKVMPLPIAAQRASAMIAALLLALAVRHFIELPLLQWRKNLTVKGGIKVSAV
jgi:peptidoglycan/LPS O-acetylase OafA/YrhL